jgi:hypothetical protein
MGTLHALDYHLFTMCLYTTTHHTFTTDYSMCFHPNVGNKLMHSCHQAGVDHELSLQSSADGETLVQPNQLDGKLAPRSVDQEHHLPPAYTLLHILHHTPASCPLLSSY